MIFFIPVLCLVVLLVISRAVVVVCRKRFFVIDKTTLLDHRIIEMLKKMPINLKFLLPSFVVDELKIEQHSKNLLEAEIAKKGLENLATLKTLENVRVKNLNMKINTRYEKSLLLGIAKKFKCKIMTNDFEIFMKAKTENIQAIHLDDISEVFTKNWVLGDTVTVYIAARQRYDGISYLYDGTKVIVLNSADQVDKKVVCKIFKVTKDLYETHVWAKFVRVVEK